MMLACLVKKRFRAPNSSRNVWAVAVFLLAAIVIVGCNNSPDAEQTPIPETSAPADVAAPAVEAVQGDSDTSTIEVVTAKPSGTAERGNLVVIFSDALNRAPLSEATIVIIDSADDRVVASGITSEGIYRTSLPPDAYDVAIIQNSVPVGGMMRRDIVVEEGSTTAVTGYVAPEGVLTVQLHQPDGSSPQQDYVLTILSEGLEIYRKPVKGLTDETSIDLRTDITYDVLIEYAGGTVGQEDVVLEEEGTTLFLETPVQERLFQVLLTADGKPLNNAARIAVLDAQNKILFSENDVNGVVDVVLPVGSEYRVRAQLREQIVERPVDLDSGPLVPLILIDFQQP